MHFLAIVFLWIFHAVHKPEGIICIGNLDHICIDVKRKFFLTIVDRTIGSLINDLRRTVDCLDIATELALWRVVITAVEDNNFCLKELLHHHGTHICHIHLKSRCIHSSEGLHDHPILWKFHLIDFAYAPGSIVFNENDIRTVLVCNFL